MLRDKVWLVLVPNDLLGFLNPSANLIGWKCLFLLRVDTLWALRSVGGSSLTTLALRWFPTLLRLLARLVYGVMDIFLFLDGAFTATDLTRGSHYALLWLDSKPRLFRACNTCKIIDSREGTFLLAAVTRFAMRCLTAWQEIWISFS